MTVVGFDRLLYVLPFDHRGRSKPKCFAGPNLGLHPQDGVTDAKREHSPS